MAKTNNSSKSAELIKKTYVPAAKGSGELFEVKYDVGSGPITCLGMTFENDVARRAHFTEELRKKLKDPEFRKVEGFPIGSDEDILNLSDPPYYTACPNPFLPSFVEHHGRPYNPEDDYFHEPFAMDVSSGKNDPIYNAHAYHTKVPYLALRNYIEHYTKPGDLVLDFFAGTGMTGVAAQSSRPPKEPSIGQSSSLNGQRNAIAIDLSPIASFVAGAFTQGTDSEAVRAQGESVLAQLENDFAWMYETKHVGWPAEIRKGPQRVNSESVLSATPGTINFVVWSDVFQCPECSHAFDFWSASIDTIEGKARDSFPCANCGTMLTRRSLERVYETIFDPYLKEPIRRSVQQQVLINYTCNGKRFEKYPDQEDLARANKIDSMEAANAVPLLELPRGDRYLKDGLHLRGLTHVHQFYMPRALQVLAAARRLVDDMGTQGIFWFTSTLPWTGRENRLHIGNYFGKKGGVITSLRGVIYIASLSVETNVIERLRLRLRSAIVDNRLPKRTVAVSCQSATDLRAILTESVDYIFVDPPFGWNLMYSELNFFWESWLGVRTNIRDEAVVNKSQQKELLDYLRLLRQSFAQGYRVLKPGRWVTVEFHNSQNSVWNAIQEALQSSGFVVADVRTLDKQKASFTQVNYSRSVKHDLIISAYKPAHQTVEKFKIEAGREDGVWTFVHGHLAQLPVFVGSNSGGAETISERQPHLLFDRMVAFHIQRGVSVPMTAGEFYAGLAQRFPERESMHFLADQVVEFDRRRNTVAELRQLCLFVTDEASAIQWLRQQLQKKPQSFQELQPQFMRELQAWAKHEEMIELRKMLEQGFIRYEGTGPVPSQIHSYLSSNFKELRNKGKTDPELVEKANDRWYVPDFNKAGDLEKLREKALLKEFEEYKKVKKKLKIFRLEAVRAGFKKAWQERDYGVIVAVAEKIPNNVLEEDPKLLMWYDQAVTRMGGE